MTEVIAILASDLHISEKAPVARSAEPDWFAAMARPLAELRELSDKHEAPVVIAGDIYDKWKVNPETINFSIEQFQAFNWGVYCIPGQHDLPNHRMGEIHRSAYSTLMLSGAATNIDYHEPVIIRDCMLVLHGFPWEQEIHPLNLKMDKDAWIHLAVIHAYIWKKGYGYVGAPEDQMVAKYRKNLVGYSAAVYGDNHIGFKTFSDECNVINCGTFLRRKSDEVEYKPMIGLLNDDSSITAHYLDTSEDVFLKPSESGNDSCIDVDVSGFLTELRELGADSLDFRENITRWLDKSDCGSEVRELVLESIEEGV